MQDALTSCESALVSLRALIALGRIDAGAMIANPQPTDLVRAALLVLPVTCPAAIISAPAHYIRAPAPHSEKGCVLLITRVPRVTRVLALSLRSSAPLSPWHIPL